MNRINKHILLLLIIVSYNAFSQKTYKIGTSIWTYTSPKEYKVKIDNFKEIVSLGEEHLKKHNKEEVSISEDDTILLSISKTEASPINMVLATCQSNDNIANNTLENYANWLVEFLRNNPKEEDPKTIVSVKKKVVLIDKIKFYRIRKTINYTGQNYQYTSDFYVTEIGEKEFSITAIYDNEIDKVKIEKSILQSTFIH